MEIRKFAHLFFLAASFQSSLPPHKPYEDSDSDSADDEASQADTQPPKARGWVKKSLAILFEGPEAKAKLTTRISKREIDAEAELMEARMPRRTNSPMMVQ
ncbi:hypothetical protein B0H11DRAFT_2226743 [Mycena galericulata]|nr:hypothetical protein B0H11DRAFT_2226743 [Mycena galericulata]